MTTATTFNLLDASYVSLRIADYADGIQNKTMHPEAIPVFDRDQVQDELICRYLLKRQTATRKERMA